MYLDMINEKIVELKGIAQYLDYQVTGPGSRREKFKKNNRNYARKLVIIVIFFY